jgi:CRP/FNR family cyclic AMP-dependent transcriptional regulator
MDYSENTTILSALQITGDLVDHDSDMTNSTTPAAAAITHPTMDQVREVPLFSGLDESEIEQISRGMVCKHFDRDVTIFSQGDDADFALFISSGVVNVFSALPGGDVIPLAVLESGSTIGETSLVETSIRSASVKTVTDVTGLVMERWFFQGFLSQTSPVASSILGQLTRLLCTRIQTQYEDIIWPGHAEKSHIMPERPSIEKTTISLGSTQCPFPYKAFLPCLEFFSAFQPDDIDVVTSRARILEVPQGTMLYEFGARQESCFFVVRGALELCVNSSSEQTPLAVMGPGKFLNVSGLICGQPQVGCGRVREDATLLEFSGDSLLRLLSEHSLLALKFQLALCRSLIVDSGNVNKRIARQSSQASVNISL